MNVFGKFYSNQRKKAVQRTIKSNHEFINPYMYKYEIKNQKVRKFRLIMFISSIVLIILSVVTGQFDVFMNYLIDLIVQLFKV